MGRTHHRDVCRTGRPPGTCATQARRILEMERLEALRAKVPYGEVGRGGRLGMRQVGDAIVPGECPPLRLLPSLPSGVPEPLV